MSTNLRLDSNLEVALKQRAGETGRSQQELIREAIRVYLNKDLARGALPLGRPRIHPARAAYRQAESRAALPEGVSDSLELLGRSDHF